jgi:cell division protein FtsB
MIDKRNIDESPKKQFLRIEPDRMSKIKYYGKVLIWIVGIFLLISFFLGGKNGTFSFLSYKFYEHRLQKEIEREKHRSDSLENVIQRLQTDSAYIERIARERHKMIRNGEKIIIFKNDSTSIR